jgi:hypothetical protein
LRPVLSGAEVIAVGKNYFKLKGQVEKYFFSQLKRTPFLPIAIGMERAGDKKKMKNI